MTNGKTDVKNVVTIETLDATLPDWRSLRTASRTARKNAYARYSNYQVGAAVLTSDNTIVQGCNVENASYGLTICAERVAVCSAVAGGRQDIVAVCVSLTGVPVPCGACRQFLHEFNPDMLVLLDDLTHGEDGVPQLTTITELLPRAFRL